MKTIVMSIQKEHNENIENGRKKYEFRTRPPKIEPPFKVLTYEPKSNGGRGAVVNEWICDSVGGVIKNGFINPAAIREKVIEKGCASNELLISFSNGYKKDVYALHITALKIYDKPREISDYKSVKVIRGYHKKGETKIERLMNSDRVEVTYLTRPPQSWQYIQDPEEAQNER